MSDLSVNDPPGESPDEEAGHPETSANASRSNADTDALTTPRRKLVMPGLAAILQAPVQAMLRPAVWLPGIKRLHSYKEWWILDGIDKNALVLNIKEATKTLTKTDPTEAYYDVHEISTNFVRIFVYTWAEWLDVIEINLVTGEVSAFSTGLVPLSVPFAAILNLVFCWVPFYDSKFNRDRLQLFREAMDIQVVVSQVQDDC